MKRTVIGFTTLAAVALLGSLANAQAVPTGTWMCARDNFNDAYPGEQGLNSGARGAGRWARANGNDNLYCDWTDVQKTEIRNLLATDPGPGKYWQLRFEITGYLGADDPNPVVHCGAFVGKDDWLEGVGDQTLEMGACHLYRDDFGARNLPWTDEYGNPVANFYGLTFIQNGYDFHGYYRGNSGEGNFYANQVVLTPDVVGVLLDHPYSRGLRCWSDYGSGDPGNLSVCSRDQWSAGPRLALYAVDDPPIPPGVATRTYDCDRDVSLGSWGAGEGNAGDDSTIRAGKGARTWGEQALVEWNDSRTVAIGAWIEGQLAANRLAMADVAGLGKAVVNVQYQFSGAFRDSPGKVVAIETVWSNNQWAEGTGTSVDRQLAWDMGTKAATWMSAQRAFIDADGDPLTVNDRTIDPANSVDWWDPVSGAHDQAFDDLSGTLNTVMFTGTLTHSPDHGSIQFNSVDLDYAFWRDLLSNVQAEGTMYETHYNCVGIRQYRGPGCTDDNWQMYTKEQWGGDAAPRLVITIRPAPGDAVIDGEVNVLDLGALANNYKTGTGKVWTDGDFNGDGEVNVLDLGILANNYRWRSSLAGGGGQPVPEPCSVILTLAGVGLLAARRRRR